VIIAIFLLKRGPAAGGRTVGRYDNISMDFAKDCPWVNWKALLISRCVEVFILLAVW